jgi:hypothetical protein
MKLNPRTMMVMGWLAMGCAGIGQEWVGPMQASLEKMAAGLTERLKPWAVPNRVYRIADYGAVGDGATVNTGAVQKAMDACAAAGGGVVRVENGRYVTGTVDLRSGVMLEVAKGAALLGSTNFADYPARVPRHETVMDTWMKETQSLIFAEGCVDVGIRGEGVIDGRGSNASFPGKAGIGPMPNRPFLIRMIECRGVVLDGIHLRNAASWMQNYLACDDLIFQGVNVENLSNGNNDGFDIDGCHDVIMRHCYVDSEDDGLCFKAASLRSMENVLVEDSEFYSTCNAVKFGTDSEADFRKVLIRRVKVGGPAPGMPMNDKPHLAISGVSWETTDGAAIEDVLVTDATLDRAEAPFCLRLGSRGRTKPSLPKPAPGILRRVVFENIRGGGNGKFGSIITGIPGARVEDVVFRNIALTMSGGGTGEDAARVVPEVANAYPDAFSFGHSVPAFGFFIRHAEGVTFDNVKVTPAAIEARPEFKLGEDVSDIAVPNAETPLH